MKRLLFLLLTGIFAMSPLARSHAGPITSDLHRVIAQQQGWLNTARAITADDLAGRILLLDFWTFCCINCMQIIPDLKYLEHEFGHDLTVIGVHSAKFKNEQDTGNIRNAILRYGIEHPVVNDFDFTIWESFGVHSWPTLILITPDGRMANLYSGEGHRAEMEADIEALRKKYAGKLVNAPLPLAPEKDKTEKTLLSFPSKLAYAKNIEGQPKLFISDSGNNRIVLTGMDGTIVQTIGSGKEGMKDGAFNEAQFRRPQGVLYDGNHTLYVADTENHALRAVDLAKRTIATLAGNGTRGNIISKGMKAKDAALASPWDLAFFPDENHIVIANAGTHQLLGYDIEKHSLKPLAGNGRESIDDGKYPDNSLSQPSGLSAHGGALYFVDSETSSLRVMEKDGAVKTLIGSGLFDFGFKDGTQGTALMQHPLGVFADDSGVYIADSYNHSIRLYDIKTGALSTLAGNGKPGTGEGALADAQFNEPAGLLKRDNTLYVTDTNNQRIEKIDLAQKRAAAVKLNGERAATYSYTGTLPNLEHLPEITLAARKESALALSLQQGWHINAEAPSYLALFENNGDKPAVREWNAASLREKDITLPKLAEGKNYILQGTVYYCEDKAGAQCLIKSVEMKVRVGEAGTEKLTIPVN